MAIPKGFQSIRGIATPVCALVRDDKLEAGVDVWNEITAELEWRESNVEDCLQPNLIKPTERPATRERFWNEYQQFGIKYIMKKYGSIPMKSRIKSKIKNKICIS